MVPYLFKQYIILNYLVLLSYFQYRKNIFFASSKDFLFSKKPIFIGSSTSIYIVVIMKYCYIYAKLARRLHRDIYETCISIRMVYIYMLKSVYSIYTQHIYILYIYILVIFPTHTQNMFTHNMYYIYIYMLCV